MSTDRTTRVRRLAQELGIAPADAAPELVRRAWHPLEMNVAVFGFNAATPDIRYGLRRSSDHPLRWELWHGSSTLTVWVLVATVSAPNLDTAILHANAFLKNPMTTSEERRHVHPQA